MSVLGRGAPAPAPRAFAVLWFLALLDAAGYGLIAPVLPQVGDLTGAGPVTLGALVASFGVGVLAGFPLGARAVAASAPERVLRLGLIVMAAGAFVFAFASGLPVYFLGRFLMGLGSGAVWVGMVFTAMEWWPGQEYPKLARIFGAYGVGGLIGPAIGGVGGIRLPLVIYVGALAVGLVVSSRLGSPPARRAFSADRSALRRPGFALACVAILFAILGLGAADAVLPLHFDEQGLTQGAIGLMFVMVGVLDSGSTFVASRFSPGPVMAVAIVAMTAGIALAGVSTSVALWLPAMGLLGIGVGAGSTASTGLLLEAVPAERIVTAFIVWSQLGILGYLIGPLLGGAVAETAGFSAVGLVPMLAAIPVLWLARRRAERPGPVAH